MVSGTRKAFRPVDPRRARGLPFGESSLDDIGGRSAPVGVLAEIGEHLVAVHGQADQWRLRQSDQHRAVLDQFGGAPLQKALQEAEKLNRKKTEELRVKIREAEGPFQAVARQQ